MEGTEGLVNVRRILTEELKMDGRSLGAWDYAVVAYVCWLILMRSADLCAAAVATLIDKIDKGQVTVGVDGAVYRNNRSYASRLEHKTRDLVHSTHKKVIVHSKKSRLICWFY